MNNHPYLDKTTVLVSCSSTLFQAAYKNIKYTLLSSICCPSSILCKSELRTKALHNVTLVLIVSRVFLYTHSRGKQKCKSPNYNLFVYLFVNRKMCEYDFTRM